MNLVDSRKKQLDYAQILHAYHANIAHKDEKIKNFAVWMTVLAATIGESNMEGDMVGNTVFYYRRGTGSKSGMVMLWALNVDTMQNAVDNLAEMINRLADAGVNTVVSVYDNPAMSRIIRQAYRQHKSPGDELSITKIPSGKYVMQFTMGGDENV